ncbi:MAG TPA: nucleotide sugar dehydrogenase [Pantanalinema sp.]
MRVCVIGSGRLGLAMAAFLAEIGHRVRCVDGDQERLDRLERGELKLREPGLEALIAVNQMADNLEFSSDLPARVAEADVVVIAVEPSMRSSGEPDLGALRRIAQEVGRALSGETLVALKGMIPVGCAAWVGMWINEGARLSLPHGKAHPAPSAFEVVTLPGPLRAGSALHDAFHPDCLVVGASAPRAIEGVRRLYAPLLERRTPQGGEAVPLVATDPATAELIPYATTALIATRAAFADELAQLCERFGADPDDLALGLGLDRRLDGIGGGWSWGEAAPTGEVASLIRLAEEYGEAPGVLKAAHATLLRRRGTALTKLQRHLKVLKGRTVVLMGLDPGLDDWRDSLSIALAEDLLARGVKVLAYDPEAASEAALRCPALRVAACPYEAAKGADALVFGTRALRGALDLTRLRGQVRTAFLLDARNALSPGEVRSAGFAYAGLGRS